LARQEVLHDQVASVADGRADQSKKEEQVLDHRWP
jgi:hypothetical protein